MVWSMRGLLVVALALMAADAGAAGLTGSTRTCDPCRFAPGPGEPEFELRFLMDGTSLTGLAVTPVGGGKTQKLMFDEPAEADGGDDGYTIEDADLNFDGFHDLGVVTLLAANNTVEEYWLFQPVTHDFARLKFKGGGVQNLAVEPVPERHELFQHIHGSATDGDDYWYRVSGNVATAVRHRSQAVEGGLLVRHTVDLTSKPAHEIARQVGYLPDTPELAAFRRRLSTASTRAAAHSGDPAAALAVLDPVLKDVILDALDTGQADPELARQLNDYGYYLQQADRQDAALEVFQTVLLIDAKRMVAYLNLADTQYALGDQADAAKSYATYRRLMNAAGLSAKIPDRVAGRAG